MKNDLSFFTESFTRIDRQGCDVIRTRLAQCRATAFIYEGCRVLVNEGLVWVLVRDDDEAL